MRVQNDKLKADLFWFSHDSEGLVSDGNTLNLVGEECSQLDNSCTYDPASNRKLYVHEDEG